MLGFQPRRESLCVLSERRAGSIRDAGCLVLGFSCVPFLLKLLSWLCRLFCLLLSLLCVPRSGLWRCLLHCGLPSFHLSRLAFLLRSSAWVRGERVLLLVGPRVLSLLLSMQGGTDSLDVLRLLTLLWLCWLVWRLVWRLSRSCCLDFSEAPSGALLACVAASRNTSLISFLRCSFGDGL